MIALTGHRYSVKNLALTPGMKLASGSLDGTIKIWDSSTAECMQTIEGHRNEVLSDAFVQMKRE